MPRYDAKRIEPKWQQYWEQNKTFRAVDFAEGREKLYVLDMFPYPSGDGLHVGHPEGQTATDIVCRYSRMKGKNVLHPMGWDAFGLPAEQYAIKTGTHPRITTYQNIDTFRRQEKMLGFSYDWDREFSTTDPDYFRWTQWIFLQIFDTWYDAEFEWTDPAGRPRIGKGRPIAELPIPSEVKQQGGEAVRRYQDKHRLAYQHEAPVNWCPALGTVLANEEIIDGRSERGTHPVERIPLRQWMLRITAYAERLLDDLADVDWSDSIKALQRNWIGRSEGAEVDFFIGSPGGDADLQAAFENWQSARQTAGLPKEPGGDVLRVYTTRPDTLFGATYMVLAPEHPFVDRLTTPAQRAAVGDYVRRAATKSDLDRTDLAKEKTGVFTGSYAVNPVNGEKIPIWIADYVLISYGTGAIMAVPAHDERDFEFATTFGLPIRRVVDFPEDQAFPEGFRSLFDENFLNPSFRVIMYVWGNHPDDTRDAVINRIVNDPHASQWIDVAERDDGLFLLYRDIGKPPVGFSGIVTQQGLHEAFTEDGIAIHSGDYNGLPTAEFKKQITADLANRGLGRGAVNYRLRDWLFSRQHYWGEPFPIWHELDADGRPTGLMRTDADHELPVTLPEMSEFKPTGTPDPPLSKAPEDWLYKSADDGVRLMRETNSMPQWAGSCWYYLRFADPQNEQRFIDPELERYWLPVDLYVGGAEHAVLHLLYSRFWHKVLFDRGHVSKLEPFQRLVNQGMILGEAELTGYQYQDQPGQWVSAKQAAEQTTGGETVKIEKGSGRILANIKLEAEQVEKRGDDFVLKDQPSIAVESRAYKMSKSRGNVINPDRVVEQYGADSLRMYEMFMGPLEQMKPWSMNGVEGVNRFLGRVWRMIVDERADDLRLNPAVADAAPNGDQLRILHKTIKAVTEDIEKLSFNTAISRMMEFTNELSQHEQRPRAVLEPFVLLLSPFAPHIAEELWELLGHGQTLAFEPWPAYDESLLAEAEIELPVQVNGKLRAKVQVPADADRTAMEHIAREDAAVAAQLAGKTVVKVVVVPGRMVNFVVKG